MIELLKAAQERVNGSVLFKRFIEHTPLENDVAVWMAEFTQERIAELEAQNAELHRDGMEPRAVLRSRIAELEAELTKVKECNMALHKMMMAKQDLLEAELAGKDKCLSEMEDEIIRLQSIIDRRY